MPLVTTRELVDQAVARRTAVGAFNVITLEHAEGVVAGAERADAPVILQVSENAVRFHGGRPAPIAAAVAALADAAGVAVSLHLDHVEERRAAPSGGGPRRQLGDVRRLEARPTPRTSRRRGRRRDWAHANGLWLEAELGEVGGKDGAHAPGVRTDPGEAAEFVAATGVDALAVAVGSSHAMTDRSAALDRALIAGSPARCRCPSCCTAPPACRTTSSPRPCGRAW